MPYTKFDKTQPNFRNERDEFVDNSRNQLIALRDAMVDGRLASAHAFRYSDFLTPTPFYIYYENAYQERMQVDLTWGTTGGALDQPTVAVFKRIPDFKIGTPVDDIGTETITYDADGNLDTITWS